MERGSETEVIKAAWEKKKIKETASKGRYKVAFSNRHKYISI